MEKIPRLKFIGLPQSGKSAISKKIREIAKEQKKEIVYISSNNCVLNYKIWYALKDNPMQNAQSIQESLLDEQIEHVKYLHTVVNQKTELIIEENPIESIQFFNLAYLLQGYITEFGFMRLANRIEKVTQLQRKYKESEKYNDIYVFVDFFPEYPINLEPNEIKSVHSTVYCQMKNFIANQKKVRKIDNSGKSIKSKLVETLISKEELNKKEGMALNFDEAW